MTEKPRNVANIYPLSSALQGLLYQTLLSDNDALYRTQSRIDINGSFDTACFRRSLEFLVARHAALRTLFLHEGLDAPVAVEREQVALPIYEHDLGDMDPGAVPDALDALAVAASERPMPLDKAPLLAIDIVALPGRRHHVIFDIHHLVFDGWSSVLLFNELQTVQAAFLRGEEPDLPAAGNYAEHVKALARVDRTDLLASWRQKLHDFDTPTPLPARRGHAGADALYARAHLCRALDGRLSEAVRQLARRARVTVNCVVQAAWALLLSRHVDNDDVLFGVTVNGRGDAIEHHARTFGLFVNTLPLRIRCQFDMPLGQWLGQVQRELDLINRSNAVSLAEVHRESAVPAGVDLFDTLIVFQSFPSFDDGASAPAIAFGKAEVHENSPYPLTLEIFDQPNISILALYIEELLSAESLEQLLRHFRKLLASMTDPGALEQGIGQLDMLSSAERQQLLRDFNGLGSTTGGGLGQNRFWQGFETPQRDRINLASLFLERAARQPDAIAVMDAERRYSYAALSQASAAVAVALDASGLQRGDRVAVCLSRSADVYPAVLGVMLAGGVYVPLDASYPTERRRFMLVDSEARQMIVADDAGLQELSASTPSGITIHALDDLLADPPEFNHDDAITRFTPRCRSGQESSDAADAAYLMYTSGSTGIARGVLGSHAATFNRLAWMWANWPFASDEVCCQKTPLNFVDSIWELFGPLLGGVPTLVIDDDTLQQPYRFFDALSTHAVTRLVMVPSVLETLIDSVDDPAAGLSGLAHLVLSGEALSATLAERLFSLHPALTLLNLYGSTEVSADVSAMVLTAGSVGTPVSIGRPISHCQIYIVDQHQRLMPQGAVGEIAVAGRGLALGYHRQSPGERQVFVDNPFGYGRMYLTGDLGQQDDSGILTHRGRRDSQLKIHGQRLDLAEVEHVLSGIDGVDSAVALSDARDRLVAFYRGQELPAATIDAALRSQLAPWAVPSAVTWLSAFPTLPNGKLDKRRLREHEWEEDADDGIAPRTDTERLLAGVWQQVLGGERPSVHDNFVQVGGSSLLGMRFNARVFREFKCAIPPRLLLTADLAQLALYLVPDDRPATDVEGRGRDTVPIVPGFLRSGSRAIFCIEHRPLRQANGKAVLFVPSVAHEYMQAHRLMQLQASTLAREGYHCLRFDFSGFGDSAGTPRTASLAQWRDDIRAACQHLRERAGVDAVSIVTLRLGAAVLLDTMPDGIDQLVAWDPIFCGQRFLDRVSHLHRISMRDLDRYRFRQRLAEATERFGYTYSQDLLSELAVLDVREAFRRFPGRLDLVITGRLSRSDATWLTLLPAQRKPAETHLTRIPDIELWNDDAHASQLLFAHQVHEAVCSALQDQR
ncbi:MAG: hypothetical protein CSB44_04020 [Gammaproteobacteria bacterium]|nr:MAG: hypothetical protein CSB44_04020 [Gammaproteobacteria bacterium]